MGAGSSGPEVAIAGFEGVRNKVAAGEGMDGWVQGAVDQRWQQQYLKVPELR
jgi:hypothetical protein